MPSKKKLKFEKDSRILADPEFWDNAFKIVAAGEYTRSIGDYFGVSNDRMMAHIKKDPALSSRYEEARLARAQYHTERIEKIIDDVETGAMDAHAAKVSMDGRKWLASRMDPHLWGDKTRVDMNVTDTTQLHLEAIRELGMMESYTEDVIIDQS